ncbi:MAG: sulfatase-like hydrolase/transferase [Candidatus Promineifilaceae bacterium]
MTKPNVVLLTIDTLRLDRLGCFGCDKLLTPNIDRLAAEGVRFSQAVTGGSWTQASFPVIMTSTYASMYGGCLGKLSAERPSPAEALTKHGYRTAAFSTSPLLSRAYGYDRGFQHFVDLIPNEKDPALREMKGGQRLLRSPLTHKVSKAIGKQTRPAKVYVDASGLIDAASQWMGEDEHPFFAWVHFMDVHWPYHREDALSKPEEIAQAWRDLSHLHEANWNGAPISPEQRDHYIRLYEDALVYTDVQIGRLLDDMAARGVLDNTIIVLVSDHGEEFLEHGRWGHWEDNLYDEILRVPLIFRLPGLDGARNISQQVSTIDIMPTILDLCGCPSPTGMMGHSLVPLWQEPGTAYPVETAVTEMWRDHWHIIAVRTTTHKYIWDSKKPDASRLYDLLNDPEERVNIADRHPDIVRKLHSVVDARLADMALTAPDTAVTEPDLDDDVLARLRGLGYVE